jgi:hypothetical protein
MTVALQNNTHFVVTIVNNWRFNYSTRFGFVCTPISGLITSRAVQKNFSCKFGGNETLFLYRKIIYFIIYFCQGMMSPYQLAAEVF